MCVLQFFGYETNNNSCLNCRNQENCDPLRRQLNLPHPQRGKEAVGEDPQNLLLLDSFQVLLLLLLGGLLQAIRQHADQNLAADVEICQR